MYHNSNTAIERQFWCGSVSTIPSTREMGAILGLPTSTNKPLPRSPTSFDPIRRCTKWLYYHPSIQKVQGYHFGILCCAVASALVMVINLTLTVWASKRYGHQGGLGTILDGKCSETKKLAMWTHLGINVLSTLLLGASNYTMQCLSSPTREDINRAHSQNLWLNIGTPSIRNLLGISRSRMVMWWLVAISSVPLHLLYNSAVFTTLSTREYNAFLVQRDFLTGAPFDISHFSRFSPWIDVIDNDRVSESLNQVENIAHTLQDDQGSLQKLANRDCIRTYAAEFVSSHANVLLVPSAQSPRHQRARRFRFHGRPARRNPHLRPREPKAFGNSSISDVWWSQSEGPTSVYPWFCGGVSCDADSIAEEATWEFCNYVNGDCLKIEYCLSQTVEEHCKLQFSGAIMMVVIVCNLCKMIIMGYIAWKRPLEPLVTVGDAIASFLDEPDMTTMGICLSGKDQFEKMSLSGEAGGQAPRNWGQGIMRCDLGASYWFRAVSIRRWTLFVIL